MKRSIMGIDHIPYVQIGGVKWATTNLITNSTGENYFAESSKDLGSIFQFGRKYGAPISVQSTVSGKLTIAQGNTLTNASKVIGNNYSANPGTYQYAWCSETPSASYNSLWNAGKGEFDPCPDGWRVPTKNELELLYQKLVGAHTLDGTYGYLFRDGDSELFIPKQAVPSWGIETFRVDMFRIMSCELNNKTPYYLNINVSTSIPTGVVASFMNDGGVIRAVKM